MVYSETGRSQIYVNVNNRMISSWAKLLSGCDNKIVNVHKCLYI